VRRTIQRFARNHGAAAIDQAFEVSVSFSDSPLDLFEASEEPDGSLVFLYMEGMYDPRDESDASFTAMRVTGGC
jgi:hypothetical protein